jgi:hypothetical protein
MAKQNRPTKPANTAPKKPRPRADTEAQRLKKEEQARTVRRRNRQFIGLALSVLVVVGAVSIVLYGINLVRSMLDTSDQYIEYQERFEPFVWFDVLPFESVTLADESAIKQVCLWGVLGVLTRTAEVDIQRTDRGEPLIPAIEVDRYGVLLFGPDFRFSGHVSFTDATWDLSYLYNAETQMYTMPSTGLDPRYLASVVEINREPGGVLRVVMGYVSTRAGDNQVVQQPDYTHPAKYMDFVLQRDGNSYYLQRVQTDTTHTDDSLPAASVPAQVSVPDYIPPALSSPGSEAPPAGDASLAAPQSAPGEGEGADDAGDETTGEQP